jgi:hypothetical protein
MTIKMAFGHHKHMVTKSFLLTMSTINQNYFNHHKQLTIEPISIIKNLNHYSRINDQTRTTKNTNF